MANIERLNKVLTQIRENPDGWHQYNWHTCFAGWTVRLAGTGVEVREDPECGACCTTLVRDEESLSWTEIRDEARGLLGLNDDERYKLFDSHNTLSDLEDIVTGLAVSA